MTVQVAVFVAMIAGAVFWWCRMNAQTQKALAQFKAEAEALHSNRLLRAQEKFNQAELALSRDNSEGNQRAYNEAVYELNAIKAAV